MGIASDLGYDFRSPNLAQRLGQKFGSTPIGAKSFALSLRHLDGVVRKLTKGERSASSILGGLPVLDITTTGRRSGARRTTKLIAIPYSDTLALLGTNFGGKKTPAWVHNLEADPHLTVSYRGATVEAVAVKADAEQQAEVLRRSESIYPGYREYQKRITGRTLRIFILQAR